MIYLYISLTGLFLGLSSGYFFGNKVTERTPDWKIMLMATFTACCLMTFALAMVYFLITV